MIISPSPFIITLVVVFAFLFFRKSQNAKAIFNGGAQIQPKFLAIGEEWQPPGFDIVSASARADETSCTARPSMRFRYSPKS